MGPLLLDTHILLWWHAASPELLPRMEKTIATAERGEGLAISVMTVWEIAKLVQKGGMTIEVSLDQWFTELEDDPRFHVLPLSARIILESTRLGPQFHKDPADQLIVATARCHGLRLLTADERIRQSGVVALA